MISHSTRILTLTILLAVVAACGIGVVAADSPNEPVNYYGEATDDDGDPLPEGTEIFAVAENGDGDIVDSDSTTVDEDGFYAIEGAFTDKLTLNADDDDDVFYRLGAEDGPNSVASPYNLRGDTDEGAEGTFERNIEFASDDVSFFEVEITDSPSESDRGEELTIEYEIENTGEVADTQDIEFLVDGDNEDTEEGVEVDEGDTFSGEFTFTIDGGAEDEVEVTVASDDDEDSATIDVLDSPFFDVDIDVTDEVVEGDDIDVEYTIENTGDEEDTQDIEFFVDGELEATEEDVDLGGGDTFDDEFTYETDEDDIDEVTVEVASDDDSADADVTVRAEVEAIDLTLDDSTIRVDQTTEATVTAQLSNDTEIDVTDDTETDITSANETIATVDDATITGEHPGIVTIEAEYDHDDGTFEDDASLTVFPIPDVTEDEDEIRERVNVSENVTPNRSETTEPVYNETADETTYGFTGATSTEEVRVQGNITGNTTTTLLNQTPPEVANPGADNDTEAIVTSQLDVPDAAVNQDGNMLMNVSTETVDDLDADADDLSIVRYNDTADEWDELDADVEEETDDVITLRAEVPGFSLFSITAEVEEEDDDEEEEEEDDEISTALLALLGVLLVILAILLYLLYQRLQEDDESDTSDQDDESSADDSDSTGTE